MIQTLEASIKNKEEIQEKSEEQIEKLVIIIIMN